MPKTILIFADGTGNEGGLLPDESRTNVYKLYRATRTGPESTIDPAKQIAFYVRGIGTPSPGHTSWRQKVREGIQQAVGLGLTNRIVDGYVAIISVWEPGDRIHLFGFSRGAYTARCLAHVLEVAGIPTREADGTPLSFDPPKLRTLAQSAVTILYKWGVPVADQKQCASAAQAFCAAHACVNDPAKGSLPYFVGVWDTVAASGWAHLGPVKYDLHYPKALRFARHAMAIDEYRKDFVRVPWGGSGTFPKPRDGEPIPFQQIWFAGNHADIGGSYPENESRLSDITLKWMADFIEHELPPEGRVTVDRRILNCFPSAAGMMHDECMVGIGGTPLRWYPKDRDVPSAAVLHESVYERLKMDKVRNFTGYGPYRPAPLRNHTKAKDYFEDVLVPPAPSPVASGGSTPP
jgi:uncharacterized protein (DUF2235 family)